MPEIKLELDTKHPMYKRGYQDGVKTARPALDPETGLAHCGCGKKAVRRHEQDTTFGYRDEPIDIDYFCVQCPDEHVATDWYYDSADADEAWQTAMGFVEEGGRMTNINCISMTEEEACQQLESLYFSQNASLDGDPKHDEIFIKDMAAIAVAIGALCGQNKTLGGAVTLVLPEGRCAYVRKIDGRYIITIGAVEPQEAENE